MIEQPLVSIVVITYNSSDYVLETLESAKDQTYKNIELIISDDCSTDNTVEICKNWLEENKERFKHTELIKVEKNTGIPANCNRGVKASMGEWVKLIAGDDILFNEAIKNYLDFLKQNKEVHILHSEIEFFENDKTTTKKSYYTKNSFFWLSAKKQYQKLLHKNTLNAPSIIFSKFIFDELDGFDESFKLIEDYPFWLKATKAGYKIWFFDKTNVYYRIHNQSVQRNNSPFVSSKFISEAILVYSVYRLKNLSYVMNLRIKLRYSLLLFLNKSGFNNNLKTSRFLYFLVYKL
jgi:alpha-1,3-rhamnosyltransferase